ncbi:MAG: DegT/DnrJ/EryC1/StrS family aminotransferase [Promethearchaeota archaeon]
MPNKYGKLEKKYLNEVIDSGHLFYVKGKMTEKLLKTVRKYFNIKYVAAMSSGTAAIHCAIAALQIPPGNEVITTPITDMGTLIGLLYQNLIPVFADVDSNTYNITAESIKKTITDKTKAIIVVHLAGNPAEMDEIMELAQERGIFVIEDCAQAYGAKYKGKLVGTIGDIGCYSLNAYKHISAGDGGFIITNNEDLGILAENYADKFYDRNNKCGRLSALAPNYRITELQSAVALAQFSKLEDITLKRHQLGNLFNKEISDLEGIYPHKVHNYNYSTYWFTMFRIDPNILNCDRDKFVKSLHLSGFSQASAGYIPKPIYLESVFVNKSFFPKNIWPAEIISGKKYEYTKGLCPNAEHVLNTAIRVPIDEFMNEKTIIKRTQIIKKVYSKYLSKRKN